MSSLTETPLAAGAHLSFFYYPFLASSGGRLNAATLLSQVLAEEEEIPFLQDIHDFVRRSPFWRQNDGPLFCIVGAALARKDPAISKRVVCVTDDGDIYFNGERYSDTEICRYVTGHRRGSNHIREKHRRSVRGWALDTNGKKSARPGGLIARTSGSTKAELEMLIRLYKQQIAEMDARDADKGEPGGLAELTAVPVSRVSGALADCPRPPDESVDESVTQTVAGLVALAE